jgi:hypothetical protein
VRGLGLPDGDGDGATRAKGREPVEAIAVGVEVVATVQQRHGGGAALDRGEGRVQRRVAVAGDDDALSCKRCRQGVDDRASAKGFEALDLQSPRLEGADTAGDDDRAGVEGEASDGLDVEAAIAAGGDPRHGRAEMERHVEGRELLEQALREARPGGRRHGRDVVDRLLAVEEGALATSEWQRVDHVAVDPEQPELERLEQADRSGADDERVGRRRRAHRVSGRAPGACPSCPSIRRRPAAAPCAA